MRTVEDDHALRHISCTLTHCTSTIMALDSQASIFYKALGIFHFVTFRKTQAKELLP
jgi:hypothetical protein